MKAEQYYNNYIITIITFIKLRIKLGERASTDRGVLEALLTFYHPPSKIYHRIEKCGKAEKNGLCSTKLNFSIYGISHEILFFQFWLQP